MTHATYFSEEQSRQYRELSQRAIELALASRWEDAAATNHELLSAFPRDSNALNRLGKALSELGQYAHARRAYADALAIDPNNKIAKKNIERLAALDVEQAPDGQRAASDCIRSWTGETHGKLGRIRDPQSAGEAGGRRRERSDRPERNDHAPS